MRLLMCLFLAIMAFCCSVSNAEACEGHVVGALFRVGTAPVRLARQVQLNSLERRSARGNKLAAARTEGVSQRKAARACY